MAALQLQIHCDAHDRADRREPTVDHIARRVTGCEEYTYYRLELDQTIPLRLFVADEEIPPVEAFRCVWRWRPDFYAGEVELQFEDVDGVPVLTYSLEVGPAQHKLGGAEFSAMVAAVAAFDARLTIGDAAARGPIGSLGDQWLWQAGLARLRIHGPALLHALRSLSSRPRTSRVHSRERVPLAHSRHIDSAGIRRAAMDPLVLGVLKGGDVRAVDVDRVRFDVPTATPSFDHAAHRTLLAMLLNVQRRALEIESLLAKQATRPERSDALRAATARRIGCLRRLRSDLSAQLKRTPFHEVSRAEVSAAGLNTVSADPVYSKVHRLAWRASKRGLAGPHEDEDSWTIPTWQIYERWAFLQVIGIVDTLLPMANQRVRSSKGTASPDAISVAWTQEGRRIQVRAQPIFRAFDKKSGHGLLSISGERVPDIVLLDEGEQEPRFLVLDAKYRVSREGLLEGMTSAHLYRDSLRFHGRRATSAYVLSPKTEHVPWLADEAFMSKHGVGVLALSPGSEAKDLRRVIDHFLRGV